MLHLWKDFGRTRDCFGTSFFEAEPSHLIAVSFSTLRSSSEESRASSHMEGCKKHNRSELSVVIALYRHSLELQNRHLVCFFFLPPPFQTEFSHLLRMLKSVQIYHLFTAKCIDYTSNWIADRLILVYRLLKVSNFRFLQASVFSPELQTEQNRHLGTFFLLAPALTISSTEAMLAAKEQLAKKGARELRGTGAQPLFTDDGFALGLAYLLEVLGQSGGFDSLGWLRSAQVNLLFHLAHAQCFGFHRVALWGIFVVGHFSGKRRAFFPKFWKAIPCYFF
jgi:hypothetical protein